jgi:carbonic anhydrase
MSQITPEDALKFLKAGNKRFVDGNSRYPLDNSKRRSEFRKGQKPFAAILCCSDSRVPPEIIFDCGIGDIFVVRVAGNILGTNVLGSIEYAVTHLRCTLLVVLGHESCGAVTAALSSYEDIQEEPGNIIRLIERVRKNIPGTLSHGGKDSETIKTAILENIESVVKEIQSVTCIAAQSTGGKLKVVTAYYSLESGEVVWD